MEIDDSLKKTGLSIGTPKARAGKGADKTSGASASTTAPAPLESDSVHLSPQAQALSQLTGSNGVFDTKKVEEIKAAIAEGRFKVDPEKVADGLLDSVNDLVRSRKA